MCAQAISQEERCNCGKLLLKKTSRGFEIKCHRCKTVHLIPFDRITEDFQNLCPVMNIDGADKDTE